MGRTNKSVPVPLMDRESLIRRLIHQEGEIEDKDKRIQQLTQHLADEKKINDELVQKLIQINEECRIDIDHHGYGEHPKFANHHNYDDGYSVKSFRKSDSRSLNRDDSTDSGISNDDDTQDDEDIYGDDTHDDDTHNDDDTHDDNDSHEEYSSSDHRETDDTSDEEKDILPDHLPRSPNRDRSTTAAMRDENELKRNVVNRKVSLTPINELMLACTLCGMKIRIEDIEHHSAKCSSIIKGATENANDNNDSQNTNTNNKNINNNNIEDSSKSNTLSNDNDDKHNKCNASIIVATVTISNDSLTPVSSDSSCTFKVICKTNMKEYGKTLLVASRTVEDFVWYRNALEQYHSQYIIPPLRVKENVTGNLREAQRFLSRVCAHDVLKCSILTRSFFKHAQSEFGSYKESFEDFLPKRLKPQKPSVEMVDETGLIFRSQQYLSQLATNLNTLVECVRNKRERKPSKDLGLTFLALSEGETNETFLQNVTKALGEIISNLEDKEDVVVYDESVFSEDLDSIKEYVHSALELISRVQRCIDTYLYWTEEVEVLEQMRKEGLVTNVNEKSISKLWAEASCTCRTAQQELEEIGNKVSDELVSFDRRKEHELRQILIEYAESKFHMFQTFQSKWMAVKVMLNSSINPHARAIDYCTG